MTTGESLTTLQAALAGAYALEGEIGRGGMGVVYRARDLRHDRIVAVKVLREDVATTVGAARFSREVRIEARLQHPNIVPVYEWGDRDGLLFCVMPLIEGESLRARLRRERQLPIADALRIAREVASALGYAHTQRVVHRDVKPENILLSSGHAVLSDFGVARLAGLAFGDTLTDSGLAVGTVSYMSPEQAAGDSAVDGRSDIYALGCVLYEMLTGDPPFGSSTPQIIIARHLHDRPPPLTIVRPSVPPHVVAALDRALEKVPADRFATAEAFADALETTGATPAAVAVSSTGGLRSAGVVATPARARWKAWALALVPLLGATAWLLWSWRAAPLDDHRVVVFPLTYASDSGRGATTGWDVAIAIEASLEHAEPLRVIDGWSHLAAATRNDVRLLSAREARRLSRERGARHFVDGAITRRADSATVVLRLHDVLGDSVVAQESETGAASELLPSLGLRAVNRLLPRLLDPARRFDASDMAARSPSAVALWIQGERLYRQSRFAPALDLFRRAVNEDSALRIAAVRGAQAASWEGQFEEAEALTNHALARLDLLPKRHADFARGLRHYLIGNADSATAIFEALVASDRDGAEPAMALAEVHHHLMAGVATPPDSAAERWLTESVGRDSAFTPPLHHLAEIAVRRGDVARAESLVSTLRRRGAEPSYVRPLELMVACVRGAGAPWEATANVDPVSALSAAKELSAHLAQPGCAESGFRAVLGSPNATAGVRWSALLGLQGLLVATRRDIELRALLDSTVAAGTTQALSLYIIDAVAGADRALMRPKADEATAFAQRAYGASYERASPQTRWVLGLWHALEGDTARLAAMRAVSDSVAAHGGRRERLFAGAMAAHLALARGDTALAIDAFRRLVPSARRDSLTYDLFEPLGVERATLARLLLARGEHAEAIRVASALDHPQPVTYLAFLPVGLAVRSRAALALDRKAEAEQYMARLRALEARGRAQR